MSYLGIAKNKKLRHEQKYTSATTHNHFLLLPSELKGDDVVALDRAYIYSAKFEEMTQLGTVYVTKMKKNLVFEVLDDVKYQDRCGKMAFRVQHVVFTKKTKEMIIAHHARIITYPDIQKKKLISLLTNDFEMPQQDIINIYRKRWIIEGLLKQLKQNFYYNQKEDYFVCPMGQHMHRIKDITRENKTGFISHLAV